MGFIELRVQTADGKSSPNPNDIKPKLTQLDKKNDLMLKEIYCQMGFKDVLMHDLLLVLRIYDLWE